MKKKREKLKDVKKDKYVKIIILIIALFLLFILLFLVNIIFLKLNLFTVFVKQTNSTLYPDSNNALYTGRDNTLYTGGVWTFSDEKNNVTNETIELIKNALNEGLPLAGNWNSNMFDHKWQVNTLVPDGHVIMPWFGIPWQGFFLVNVTWESVKTTYDVGINFSSIYKLPIAFKSPQWENGLLIDYWCNKSPEENPCFQLLNGSFEKSLSPLGAIQAWYDIGYASSNQDYIKKMQELYPDPPLVVFLENNEATKRDDLLNNKQYLDLYSSNLDYMNTSFISQVAYDGWVIRYRAMLKGFNDGLINENWKAKAIQIPYIGYARTIYSVLNQVAWDGAMPSSYTARYQGDRDYLVMGPQVEGGNLRFGFKEARRIIKPDFFSNVITWYGDLEAVQGLEQAGQTFTYERYRGTTQFVLWEVQPQLLNEFRGSTQSRSGWYGQLFNILLNSVDRVHYNPVLRKFWQEGTLVANNRSTYFKQSLPSNYTNADTFFVLDSDANNATRWTDSSSNVNVFSLAYLIGEEPNRQWLLYTHAPLGTRQNVNITIPDYQQVQVPIVEQGGSFYLVNESENTVESIGSLNFVHNHAPVAGNDFYQIIINENLNVTNFWANVGTKPIWYNDNDSDGDSMNFSLVSSVKNGELNFNSDGTFFYKPDNNFKGIDNFKYVAYDGKMYSNIATAFINVRNFSLIIDDGDVGYSENDSWDTGSITATYTGYGTTYRLHACGADSTHDEIPTATWTFNNLENGAYDAYVTWSPSWSRSTSVPYNIFDDSLNLSRIYKNQNSAPNDVNVSNVLWEKLGTYNINSGILKVQVSTAASWTTAGKTIVVADAARIVKVSDGQERIIDNIDSGYSETAGWVPQSSLSSYNNDRRIQISSETTYPEKSAYWNFTNLKPGVYEVFTSWVASSLNNRGDVYYTIKVNNQTFYKVVNQKSAPDNIVYSGVFFDSLGTYKLTNDKLKVEVDNRGKKAGKIIADAVGLIGPQPFNGIIIDDGDIGYARIGGFHQKSLGFNGDGDYLYSEHNGTWDAANWTFYNLSNGPYKVYVTWQDPGNWAPNADVDYAVFDNNEQKGLISLSQHEIPSDNNLDNLGWKDLGTFDITSGTLKIKVSAAVNHSAGRVSADVVWISFVGSFCGDNVCDLGEDCFSCISDCGDCPNDLTGVVDTGTGGSGEGSGGSGGSGGMGRGSAVVNNLNNNLNNNLTQNNNTTQMNLLNIPNSSVSNLTELPTKENGRYGNIFYYAILIIILIAIIIIFILLIKTFKRENTVSLDCKSSVQ